MQSCASAAKLLGGGPILETGFKTVDCFGLTATSDRRRTLTMFCSSASESLFFLSPLSLTPLAIRRQPEPRQWLPDATRQLAICAPELRLLFCGFCHPQFESGTTGPMHCSSERAKSAKPTESFRRVLVRCPPWRALSLAVCCRSRRVRQ